MASFPHDVSPEVFCCFSFHLVGSNHYYFTLIVKKKKKKGGAIIVILKVSW